MGSRLHADRNRRATGVQPLRSRMLDMQRLRGRAAQAAIGVLILGVLGADLYVLHQRTAITPSAPTPPFATAPAASGSSGTR